MKKASIFNQITAIFKPKTSKTNTPKNDPYVLITEKGKRFHLDADCPALRGANTSGVRLSQARKSGRTACDKCALEYWQK